jgi:hypothetical protein
MTADETQDQGATPKFNKARLRILLIIIYWLIACGLLCGAVVAVWKVTSPPPESPSETPDLTITLEEALKTLAASVTVFPPTATQTSTVTPTPPPTNTPIPSATPTTTSTPTITPTFTPPVGPPTLTPAKPNDEDEVFQISEWDPEAFDFASALMEGYPQTLPASKRGTNNRLYYAAYKYAAIIQQEALLDSPNEALAIAWRWHLAYNFALTSDERAAVQYAANIQRALRNKRTTLENLADWVNAQDPRVFLEFIRAENVIEGALTQLLEISTEGGTAYLWLVINGEEIFVYPLSGEFDFPTRTQTTYLWIDLTGDGINEFVIYQPEPLVRDVVLPRVFDLAQSPPKELVFRPKLDFEIGLESTSAWSSVENNQELLFTATVYPPCPVTISHRYQWNGQWIDRIEEVYNVQATSGLLRYCELVVDQAANVWGYEAAISIMETLLPDWPPASTTERTYAADAADEWRYRLGIYHALSGNIQQATDYFEGIINSPAVPASRWVQAAQGFLSGLDTPQGIYKVCVDSGFCDPRRALKNWVASLTMEEFDNALYQLGNGGVSIRSTGTFDFEGDGVPERWFTFRHRFEQKLEFWILAKTNGQVAALFVDTVDISQPTLTRYTTHQGMAIVWLGIQQSFSLERHISSDSAYITLYPPSYFYADYTRQATDDMLSGLLSGAQPEPLRDSLFDLLDSENFACLTEEDCAYFYYALAFAYELSEDEAESVSTYLKLWRLYPQTPLASIARLKLTYKPGFGPPPTSTATATPTTTTTPTATKTGTITATPTSGPSPTPTNTGQATNTATPSTPYP